MYNFHSTTVIANIIPVGMEYTGSDIPMTYKGMFSAPNVLFINVMACRVYRNIKVGDFHNDIVSVEETLPIVMESSDARLPEFDQPTYL